MRAILKPKHMKKKQKGISLIISFGSSLFILVITMGILHSLGKSIERSANIERSNQIFFATESALEAAFFHHNARGQGTHFCPTITPANQDKCNITAVDTSQIITLDGTNTTARWTINGRKNGVTGTLKENQNIEVPLFWDTSQNPSDAKTLSNTTPNITLSFSKPANFPENFNFGTTDNTFLFDFRTSRENNNKIETFEPTYDKAKTPTENCNENNSYATLCKSKFIALASGTKINIGSSFKGKILGSTSTETQLSNFLGAGKNHKITFRPLLKFQNNSNPIQKISGIPYTIQTDNNTPLPRTNYIITAQVEQNQFVRTLTLEVPEKTKMGQFNYVIFE